MGQLNEQKLPPVPSAQSLDDKGNTLSQPWRQWFLMLRDKVNVITAAIVQLAMNATAGLLSSDGAGGINARVLQAGTGITITNPDGVAGNPIISASGGAGGSPMHVSYITSTSYTAALTDAPASTGNVGWIDQTNSLAGSVNIDIDANQAFPIGTSLYIRQSGTGALTIQGLTGVTLVGPVITAGGQYSIARLVQLQANNWAIWGNLAYNNPAGYILDSLSVSAAGAYSLRRLRNAYVGSAILVRRSSDNTTLAIGFVGDTLDTASLLTFVGSGDGFIQTWYDQSGNAANFTQTTLASQPHIVTAGVVNVKNSHPTIVMSVTPLSATINGFNTGFAVNGVAGVSTDASRGFNTFVTKTSGTSAAPLDFWTDPPSIPANMYVGGSYFRSSSGPGFNAADGFEVLTYQSGPSSTTAGMFFNGTANTGTLTGSYTTITDSTYPVVLGERTDGSVTLTGWVSECVIFLTPLSTTDRHLLERNQGTYYSITVA